MDASLIRDRAAIDQMQAELRHVLSLADSATLLGVAWHSILNTLEGDGEQRLRNLCTGITLLEEVQRREEEEGTL